MGMAASQARFLGLTARKSNVEYQGQQVNQQRTALSNESANLYNQMLELEVPTPPKTSEFTETKFILQDSAGSSTSDYSLTEAKRLYNAEDEYEVSLACDIISYIKTEPSYKVGTVTKSNEGVYSIKLIDYDKNHTETTLMYNPASETVSEKDAEGKEKNPNSIKIPGKIYRITSSDEAKTLTGFDKCFNQWEEGNCYFYTDGKNNYFLDKAQLERLTTGRTYNENGISTPTDGEFEQIKTTYKHTEAGVVNVRATLEKSDTGRYSSIKISENNNDQVSSELKGREFKINTVQEMNQEKYDDAMNDYEYKKAMYEKSVSDINAKTEIVQKEDQQLELRLQQLNTEQNAIKTEMDSVSQVIKDNVEKTFKVFA